MGLDITVCRLRKAKDNFKETEDHYFQLFDDEGNYENHGLPSWTKKFETTVQTQLFDWKTFGKQKHLDINALKFTGMGYEGDKCIIRAKNDKGEKFIFDTDEIPLMTKNVQILAFDEVGYQRRGMNSKFFEDMDAGKLNEFVWTLAELQRYKDIYCDDDSDEVHPLTKKHFVRSPKTDFQKNIIDKFQEGKDCVVFG